MQDVLSVPNEVAAELGGDLVRHGEDVLHRAQSRPGLRTMSPAAAPSGDKSPVVTAESA